MTDWKANNRLFTKLIICWMVSMIPFMACMCSFDPKEILPTWMQIYFVLMLIWTGIVGFWPTGPDSYPFE